MHNVHYPYTYTYTYIYIITIVHIQTTLLHSHAQYCTPTMKSCDVLSNALSVIGPSICTLQYYNELTQAFIEVFTSLLGCVN